MPAYWVARAKIDDPLAYKQYTDLVPGIIARFGGKVLARGGRFKILEGPEKFHRFVVIEFPTLEQAVACHDSPAILSERARDGPTSPRSSRLLICATYSAAVPARYTWLAKRATSGMGTAITGRPAARYSRNFKGLAFLVSSLFTNGRMAASKHLRYAGKSAYGRCPII